MTEARIKHLESVAKDVRNQSYLDAHAALPELLGEVKRLAAKLEVAHKAEAAAFAAAGLAEADYGSTAEGIGLLAKRAEGLGAILAHARQVLRSLGYWGEAQIIADVLADSAGALTAHDREKDAEIGRLRERMAELEAKDKAWLEYHGCESFTAIELLAQARRDLVKANDLLARAKNEGAAEALEAICMDRAHGGRCMFLTVDYDHYRKVMGMTDKDPPLPHRSNDRGRTITVNVLDASGLLKEAAKLRGAK